MAAFNDRPTDEELRPLIDPERAPPYLDLIDDGDTLTVRPKPYPVGMYWASMSLPLITWGIALIWKWDDLLGSPWPTNRVFAAVMTAGFVVVAVVGRIGFGWLVRQHTRLDPFFMLDRTARTLTLLRAGVTLRHGDVSEAVEVHRRHRVKDAAGISVTYLREVSVLTRGPAGELVRYPVVIAGHAKPVGRVAAELAELFEVPRRKLVEPLFGGPWRRSTN